MERVEWSEWKAAERQCWQVWSDRWASRYSLVSGHTVSGHTVSGLNVYSSHSSRTVGQPPTAANSIDGTAGMSTTDHQLGLSRLRCQSQIASNDAMSQCHRNRRCDVRYIVRCHLWIQTAHFGYKTTQVSSLCTLLTESGQNFGCHFGRPKVGDLIGSAVLMWAADIARCIAHRTQTHRIAAMLRCLDLTSHRAV